VIFITFLIDLLINFTINCIFIRVHLVKFVYYFV
jgi:hypothetical protein